MDEKTHEQALAAMQRYARQIHESAQAGRRPGAALANYMRALRELNESEAK